MKKQVAIIKKELGWNGDQVENVPPEYNYEKIECYMQGEEDILNTSKRLYASDTPCLDRHSSQSFNARGGPQTNKKL